MLREYTAHPGSGEFTSHTIEPQPDIYNLRVVAKWTGSSPAALKAILAVECASLITSAEPPLCDAKALEVLDDKVLPAHFRTVRETATLRGAAESNVAAGFLQLGFIHTAVNGYSRRLVDANGKTGEQLHFPGELAASASMPVIDSAHDTTVAELARESDISEKALESYFHLENAFYLRRPETSTNLVRCVNQKQAHRALKLLSRVAPLPQSTYFVTHSEIARELTQTYHVKVNPQGVYQKARALGCALHYSEKDEAIVATVGPDVAQVIKDKYRGLLGARQPDEIVESPEFPEFASLFEPPQTGPLLDESLQAIIQNTLGQRIPAASVAKQRPRTLEDITKDIQPGPESHDFTLPSMVSLRSLKKLKNSRDAYAPNIQRCPPLNNRVREFGIGAQILVPIIQHSPDLGDSAVGIELHTKALIASRRAHAILTAIFKDNCSGIAEKRLHIPSDWSLLEEIAEALRMRAAEQTKQDPEAVAAMQPAAITAGRLRAAAISVYRDVRRHAITVNYRSIKTDMAEVPFTFCSPDLTRQIAQDCEMLIRRSKELESVF